MIEAENNRRPYLLVFSIISLVISLPAAIFFSNAFAPKEDLLGYGALGIAFMVLIVMLSLGLILGAGSIYRNEQPKFLSVIAPIINLIALLWVLKNLPW